MLTDLASLAGGGVLLYFGAEWLVAGASGLALSLRIPQLIVGLTVVAYGTSAPEVIVGIQAAAGGHGDVALGNVIGSNIANLGLILGVSVLVKPAQVDGSLVRREIPVLVATAALVPLAVADGQVARWEGVALVALATGYTLWMVRSVRTAQGVREAAESTAEVAAAADTVGAPAPRGRLRLALTGAVGLALLVVGGHLLVRGATAIALSVGMSERVVGLTIVAIGTSLPELATSVVAALRGHSDIAVGNVVGSNIFNVLLCLGTAAVVRPLATDPMALAVDLSVLGGMTVLGAIFMRSARAVLRWEGAMLLVAYALFLGYLVIGPALPS